VATLPIEYLRTTRLFRERIDNVEIISFEVPTHKYFSRNEIPYLATALDVDIRKLENMISDMKYGRSWWRSCGHIG
jgi:DNA polymerase III epsilon subunit-like protein